MLDDKLITPEVLNNTLAREVYPEIKVIAEPKMGKVRTVYDVGNNQLIMISSDNLSTHDVVHKRRVFAKGANLDAVSSHYFEQTKHIIGNHFLETLAPNVWLVQKAEPILVEMVFRQYLTGSGWKAYEKAEGPKQGMEFCGAFLRQGYRKNEKLDDLIFTPTAKGQVKDFPIPEFNSLDPNEDDPKLDLGIIQRNYRTFGLRKVEDINIIVDAATELYKTIHANLQSKGYLLADTKWEFGYAPNGNIILIDECVTPDSSRLWSAEKYNFDSATNEFTIVQDDKQHFRDHIEKLGLHKPEKKSELAEYWMPDDILKQGVIKYCNIREIITSTSPKITTEPVREIIMQALQDKGYLN